MILTIDFLVYRVLVEVLDTEVTEGMDDFKGHLVAPVLWMMRARRIIEATGP